MAATAQRLTANVERGRAIEFEMDGEKIGAYEGETIAAALLAAGKRAFRHTVKGEPRGVFCGIGVCFDCLVHVEGAGNVRACVTAVEAGMKVSQTGI